MSEVCKEAHGCVPLKSALGVIQGHWKCAMKRYIAPWNRDFFIPLVDNNALGKTVENIFALFLFRSEPWLHVSK